MAFSNFLIRAYESGEGGINDGDSRGYETMQCNSVCGEEKCEKTQGHKGKHASFHGTAGEPQISLWTDAGAERVNRESQENQNIRPI